MRHSHPPHTDSLDLPPTRDIAVLTKLTYVNIFWIFNYFQHREHIWMPLPVILHLLPLQTAWEMSFSATGDIEENEGLFFFLIKSIFSALLRCFASTCDKWKWARVLGN